MGQRKDALELSASLPGELADYQERDPEKIEILIAEQPRPPKSKQPKSNSKTGAWCGR